MKKCSTKLWKVMKICAAQTMIAMVICGVSVAHENYAQLLDKKITIHLRDVSLEQALYRLQDASEVRFHFSLESLDSDGERIVSVHANNQPLRDILDDLLTPGNIRYKVDERKNSIIILNKKKDSSNEERAANRARLAGSPYMEERITVTGTVTDAATQQPLAGVNILVKGTTNGTTSDAEGRYAISAEDDDVLVFSFIGYSSFEVPIANRAVIDVALKEDVKSLSEVVINAGYYETTKALQTGSIVKVDAEEIEKQPVSNPLAALQGRVAGLEVTQQSGVPGGNFRVRIRGTNSIANGNDPLYIIDGVPHTSMPMSFLETSGNILGSPGASQGSGPLNSINPLDIESIEVLKDADATAIYGSRGANGVILITTKKGQKGKINVNLNLYTGFARVAQQMDILNTQEYVTMRKEALRNDNINPSNSHAFDLLSWDTTRYTNWQKELIGGTANITDAQVSISGGEKTTHYSIGGGYHRETTVFPGSNSDQRASLHVAFRNIYNKLQTTVAINYSMNLTDLLNQDLTSNALTLPPNAPAVYKEDGQLNWTNWIGFDNPLTYTKRNFEATAHNLITSATISYEITPSLQVLSRMGYTNLRNDAVTVFPISSMNPSAPQPNNSNFSSSSFQNWITEPQLTWNIKAGPGHINALAGASFLSQTTSGNVINARGYTSESLMKNLGAAPTISSASNYYSQYRYQAFFGRLNYNLDDRYILNLTFRRDGSSRFGPGRQFALFGAVGAAWIFSNEQFMKNHVTFVSFGKLRLSYGLTGNDQIGDYQYLDTYKSTGLYNGTVGLGPQRLSNPLFAWEENRKFETNVSLAFLEGRVAVDIGYYRNRSTNQLVGAPLAPTTGFSNIQANFPATVQNTGFEFELQTTNIKRNNFNWSTSLNATVPKNRLMEFPNIESFPSYANSYVVGEPLEIRKLYRFTGVNQETGLYQVEDVNSDGSFNVQDRQTVTFVGRNFFGGIQNAVRYKSVTFSFLVQFVKQSGSDYHSVFFSAPGTRINQPTDVTDRWRVAGDYADVQRYTTSGSAYANFRISDNIITDASFVRLKNLSISYTLDDVLLHKLKLDAANIFIQSQNLFTLTPYKGLDPEVPGSVYLPPLRTLTAGFRLTL